MPMDVELQIPEDAPVRTLAELLDNMDFTRLEQADGRRGKKIPARVKFAVLVYGAMNGVYSARKVEDCCRYDVRFRWLLEGCAVPDHSTLSRFRSKVLPEAAEGLFGQLMGILREKDEIDYAHLFVDGTKLEAYANRYSFVWKKSVEKNLEKLREKAAALLELPVEQTTQDTVRKALAGQEALCREQGIELVRGKGRRKLPEQKRLEALQGIAVRWDDFQTKLDILGSSRNSYSKTDPDATL